MGCGASKGPSTSTSTPYKEPPPLAQPAEKLDSKDQKALTLFLAKPAHQLQHVVLEGKGATSLLRQTAERAMQGEAVEKLEGALEPLIEAMTPLVGRADSYDEMVALLECSRWACRAVAAVKRSKDPGVFDLGSRVVKLRKQANRAAMTQVREGSSPAVQCTHLALLEAQLRTVPRPGQNAKAAMAGLKLVGSIAKSAATMSFDPAVLTNLRDCAHMAFDEVRRRMHERMGQALRPPLEPGPPPRLRSADHSSRRQIALALDQLHSRAARASPANDQTALTERAALAEHLLQMQCATLAEAQWQPAAAFALVVGGAARAHAARAQEEAGSDAAARALKTIEWLWEGKKGAEQLGADAAFIGLRGLLAHGVASKSASSPLSVAMAEVARLGGQMMTGELSTRQWQRQLREQVHARHHSHGTRVTRRRTPQRPPSPHPPGWPRPPPPCRPGLRDDRHDGTLLSPARCTPLAPMCCTTRSGSCARH